MIESTFMASEYPDAFIEVLGHSLLCVFFLYHPRSTVFDFTSNRVLANVLRALLFSAVTPLDSCSWYGLGVHNIPHNFKTGM